MVRSASKQVLKELCFTPKSEINFIEGPINQTIQIHTIKSKIGHAVLNPATTTTV